MNLNSKNIVVFDLDHTLLKVNISYVFGRFLYKKGYFSLPSLLVLVCAYFFHTLYLLPTSLLHAISFRCLFYKKEKAKCLALAHDCVEQSLAKWLRPEIKERLKAAQERGDSVIIASSSPDFLVVQVADQLGVAQFVATRYESENGRFTHVGPTMEGQEKVKSIKKIHNLGAMDLAHTIAYSDSIRDLPLLTHVRHPVAVFPDRKLKKVALENGWEIIEK